MISDFDTVTPGATPGRGSDVQAPHRNPLMVPRGISIGLKTLMHFPEATALHGADPLLRAVERHDSVATRISARSAPGAHHFDIRLQGDKETVFTDV